MLLNLPALVIIVLAYVWVGLTETAAIAAVALNKLPIATVTVREGARSLDPASTTWREVFRMSAWTRLRHVVLPQLAPYLAAAARSGLSLVWKIVLIVELLGRPNGVGFEIGVAFQLFDVTRILAYALAFVAVMLVIETFLVQPLERHVSRWRPRTGLTSASSKSPIAPPRAASSMVLGELAFAWATARSARWSARRAAARPRCCGSSPGSTATSRAACSCPTHGTLGMVFQEPRLLPWRTVEQNVRLAAPQATDAALDTLFRDARPRRPIASTIPASSRSGSRAGWRWRAPSRSSPICCCSTSRSCRSTTRWRRGCATSWPTWSTAGRSRRCW